MKQSKKWPGKAEPRIVCAANHYSFKNIINQEDDFLIVGPRHNDLTMLNQLKICEVYLNDEGILIEDAHVEQGFIDQFGDFYTRQEAWKIAEANGQIYRRVGGDDRNGGTLYSENLY